jgi:hypothetical protein
VNRAAGPVTRGAELKRSYATQVQYSALTTRNLARSDPNILRNEWDTIKQFPENQASASEVCYEAGGVTLFRVDP